MLSFQKSFNSGFIKLVLVKTIMDEKIEIPIKTVYLASKPSYLAILGKLNKESYQTVFSSQLSQGFPFLQLTCAPPPKQINK